MIQSLEVVHCGSGSGTTWASVSKVVRRAWTDMAAAECSHQVTWTCPSDVDADSGPPMLCASHYCASLFSLLGVSVSSLRMLACCRSWLAGSVQVCRSGYHVLGCNFFGIPSPQAKLAFSPEDATCNVNPTRQCRQVTYHSTNQCHTALSTLHMSPPIASHQ